MLKKIFINLVILSLVLLPVLVIADEHETSGTPPLTPDCGELVKVGDGPNAKYEVKDCKFIHFFNFIQKIVDFLIFYISIPIAVLLFLYSGALYLFSPIAENKGKGKKIFWSVIWGFVIMIGAWLFIEFLKRAFLNENFLKDVILAP